MSDAGHSHASSLHTRSSETLSINDPPQDDHVSTSSTFSSTSTVCWIPGGLPGKLIQAFGPSTVDLVEGLVIKKRLSSISSQIDVRLRTSDQPLFGDGPKGLQVRAAYRDLVELSSGSYKAKIVSQALLLRVNMLRAIIGNESSYFDTYWNKYTLRKAWTELGNLASGPYDPHIQSTASKLRCELITKVADDLSSPRNQAFTLDTLLAGSNIVGILCEDLAYGTGAYAVQCALERISCSTLGLAQLRRLDRRGRVVFDAARRLLVDFDNDWSRSVAFRIFGGIATVTTRDRPSKLARLLSGPHGAGSLVTSFSCMIQPHAHLYHCRYGTQCTRSVEVLCTALLSACCHGFLKQIVREGLCPLLVGLIELFVRRDNMFRGYIEEDESEDADVERDQIAACKLILKILEDEEAKTIMLDAGATRTLQRFGVHPNRHYSDRELRFLADAIWKRLV